MLKIGITGGIGSGKSTAAEYFAELGIEIIDADKIAHELTAINTPCANKIIMHFGNKVLNKDGTLNRKYLRKIIYQDPKQKKWLEGLLHPIIYAQMRTRIKKVKSPYCVLVIPLLFETHAKNIVDRVLVIDSPEELQIERTLKREQISKTELKKIFSAQISRTKRLAQADDIIYNDKSLHSLKRQVQKLHKKYLAMC